MDNNKKAIIRRRRKRRRNKYNAYMLSVSHLMYSRQIVGRMQDLQYSWILSLDTSRMQEYRKCKNALTTLLHSAHEMFYTDTQHGNGSSLHHDIFSIDRKGRIHSSALIIIIRNIFC